MLRQTFIVGSGEFAPVKYSRSGGCLCFLELLTLLMCEYPPTWINATPDLMRLIISGLPAVTCQSV
jgi:hypothetical protein